MQVNFAAGVRVLPLCLLVAAICVHSANAQTLTVLHSFTGAADGASPYSGLTMDRTGNIYGTTTAGAAGYGTVFLLKRHNGNYVLNPLYRFQAGEDGAEPLATVIFGPDGSLYGTTAFGGGAANQGTVFNLRPPATFCRTVLCPWTETVLYRFLGGSDGGEPNYGDVIFDSAGALYGVTILGGTSGQGTVYRLTRSGTQWSESAIYAFTGGADGGQPFAGLAIDHAGNFFGATQLGGSQNSGTIFELKPSGSQWMQQTIYTFQDTGDGANPVSAPLVDTADDLFGTACNGGIPSGGSAYVLTPFGNNWSFITLANFSFLSCPWSGLTMDGAGNLYGVTVNGGNQEGVCFPHGCGTIYELTPGIGGYFYTDLHDFDGSDGQNPYGRVLLDGAGILYGTTAMGGSSSSCSFGCGVVWRLSP